MSKTKTVKKKIIVSKETYNQVESEIMLLDKLNYPLDLFDDLIKNQIK